MLYIRHAEEIYDVAVIGGGPAGCAAAYAAARDGARVLLVEGSGALGGMGTMGCVTCFAPFSDGEKMIYRGFAEKVFRRSLAAFSWYDQTKLDWVPTDPEACKRIYDELLKDVGVKVCFFTTLVGCDTADGHIERVYLADKTGVRSQRAKIYIDGTGDGDLAYFAGVPCEKGDANGELQPASLCFIIAGIHTESLKNVTFYGASDQSIVHEIIRSDKYPLIDQSHLCIDELGGGLISFNAGHVFVDGTVPEDVSEGMRLGRAMAAQYHAAFKELLPEAFGDSVLILTSPLLGVRETRRIKGQYVFTARDYLERRSFPDEIARNCYHLDLHTSRATGDFTKEEEERLAFYMKGESHGIPYRCLVPLMCDNLLVAGRAISCDRLSGASLRVMPNCFTTGEAAGVAAVMAYTAGVTPGKVDTAALREKLRGYGAYFV